MDQLSLRSVTPEEASLDAKQIAALYAEIFAAPPWNEAWRCTVCDQAYGLEKQLGDTCCEQPLVPYYPLEELVQTIRKAAGETHARIVLCTAGAIDADASLVGFAWGWEDTAGELNQKKFALPEPELELLCKILGIEKTQALFYLSEFGVSQSQRNRGIGKRLYNELLDASNRSTSDLILMRTSRQSPAFSIATRAARNALQVAFEYKDAADRVILAS